MNKRRKEEGRMKTRRKEERRMNTRRKEDYSFPNGPLKSINWVPKKNGIGSDFTKLGAFQNFIPTILSWKRN